MIGDTASYTAHAWWQVGAAPDAVLSYVMAHRPAGSTLTGTGSGGNSRTGSRFWMLDYSWPPEPGVLGARELQVTVTALPGSASGVLAESQSDWVVPRPSSERIPSGVGEIDITSHRPPGQPSELARVTNLRKIRQAVAVFNAMPIVQPIVYHCPELRGGGPVITFTFRRGVGGPAVAQVSFTEFPNLDAVGGPCTAVELTIHGRRRHPLIGGDFIRRIDKLLGIDLEPRHLEGK
jgi:hypothetical protein